MLVIHGDTIVWPWYGETIFREFFYKKSHSWYLHSLFWSLFSRFIPEVMNIHPQYFHMEYLQWVLLSIVVLLMYSMSANFTKYFKNNKYTIVYCFLIFPIFCYFLKLSEADWIVYDDCWSWAYFFIPIFSFVLFSEIEKYYVLGNFSLSHRREKVILTLLFMCVAISHEFFRFLICSSLFFGYIFHCLFINKKINHIKFFLCYFLVVISNILLFFTGRFQWWFSTRDNHFSLIDIIGIYKKYFLGYYHTVIVENLLLIILFFIFILLLILAGKNRTEVKKLINFSLSIFLSILLFSLVIIVGSEYTEFSFEHSGIRLLDKLCIMNLILSCCGYYISEIRTKRYRILCVMICFIPLLANITKETFDYEDYREEMNQTKERVYILEKVFELYGRNHKEYLICNDITSIPNPWSLVYYIYLYDRKSKFDDYIQKDFCTKEETYADCNQKLIKFLKEKTGYQLEEEEIKNLNFK
jgi:hypothetical protein